MDSQISNSSAAIANIPVKGIGSVILPVKQSLAGNGSCAGASLRLENVLYVPDYPCNVIGGPIRAMVSIQFTSLTPRGAMVYGDGSIAAIFMPGRDFYQVMLRESPLAPPLGRSVLDEHPEYGFMLCFTWPEQEQARWRCLQSSLRSPPRPVGSSCANEFMSSLGRTFHATGAMMSGIEQSWSGMSSCMEVDNQQRSRKRGAPEDESEGSPRRVKRTRGVDESDFRPRRILPAVFSGRA